VASSSCRGHVDELAIELFLLLHREHGTADGAETAAIDGLVSSWSENSSVSFCLRAPGYGLTLWCALGLLVGSNTNASVTVTVYKCNITMHSTFCVEKKSNNDLKLVPHFPVTHFPPLQFQSCIFRSRIFRSCSFLSWKFGPSFSSRVGRSLIYLVLHWSFIFRSCIFSRPSTSDLLFDLMTLNKIITCCAPLWDYFHQVWTRSNYPCLIYNGFNCWYLTSRCDLDLWFLDLKCVVHRVSCDQN